MAKYSQSSSDRMDESLGMRNGPKRDKKQSYKDRRDESMGMKRSEYDESMGMKRSENKRYPQKADYSMKGFEIRDNEQAPQVRKINTNSEQYDLGRVKKLQCGSRGYPAEAWNYDY